MISRSSVAFLAVIGLAQAAPFSVLSEETATETTTTTVDSYTMVNSTTTLDMWTHVDSTTTLDMWTHVDSTTTLDMWTHVDSTTTLDMWTHVDSTTTVDTWTSTATTTDVTPQTDTDTTTTAAPCISTDITTTVAPCTSTDSGADSAPTAAVTEAAMTETVTAPCSSASDTPDLTGVTHVIIAGVDGAHFEPDNIVAEVGDMIEVHFRPHNHSFTQSSFDKPCEPIDDNAIFSGFMPTDDSQGENPITFSFPVTDNEPIWFYCAQTKDNSCQMGMVGVINQNFNSSNTLAAHRKAAAMTGLSIAPSEIQGGDFGPAKWSS